MNKRKSIEKKLDALVIMIIRNRDNMTCQWCGKSVESHNAHVSHVVPRTHKGLRWDLLNLKLLCYYCHIQKWHHDPISAYQWFSARFPERAKYLEERKNVLVKYSLLGLELLYSDLKSEYANKS